MISVRDAQYLIFKNELKGKVVSVQLINALGCTLAEPIFSPIDSPPFDNSAMDGYAFIMRDVEKKIPIKIIGESAAGKSYNKKIKSGQAVRIFTGAEIPVGADTVVMQEKVSVQQNILSVLDDKIKTGSNIRTKGSHIAKDEIALEAGSKITTGAIGFLAAIGISNVKIFDKPKVTIIVTGNELQPPGRKLAKGKIFESNSVCLYAALISSGIEPLQILMVKDNEVAIKNTFREALKSSDFILFTGGISVGDYDFVGKILREEKVNEVFYKVKQKPGKPLFFGTKKNKYIFGLPGNPASVLTCFYEYVYPALKTFKGFKNPFLQTLNLPISKTITKKTSLMHFLKATTDFKTVYPLDGQESYKMQAYAESNCLIVFPEESETLQSGNIVEIHLLP